MPLSPATAQTLADAILALHVGVVLFVIFGQLAILLGAWRAWAWVRNFAFRLTHLALMVFIAAQSWLGRLCPLTIWEMQLREIAGQTTYRTSFIEYWLSRLIFFEAPWWMFVAVYTAFAGLILASWFLVPPRRRSKPTA
jgi:Protein of Unknown function (DUF2784)